MKITTPNATIRWRTGSEGPRHDPYSYEEISFTPNEGSTITLHEGLVEWLKIDGQTVKPPTAAHEDMIEWLGSDGQTVIAPNEGSTLHEDLIEWLGNDGQTIIAPASHVDNPTLWRRQLFTAYTGYSPEQWARFRDKAERAAYRRLTLQERWEREMAEEADSRLMRYAQ